MNVKRWVAPQRSLKVINNSIQMMHDGQYDNLIWYVTKLK